MRKRFLSPFATTPRTVLWYVQPVVARPPVVCSTARVCCCGVCVLRFSALRRALPTGSGLAVRLLFSSVVLFRRSSHCNADPQSSFLHPLLVRACCFVLFGENATVFASPGTRRFAHGLVDRHGVGCGVLTGRSVTRYGAFRSLLRLAFDSRARRVALAADGQCLSLRRLAIRDIAHDLVDRHGAPSIFCVLTGRSVTRYDAFWSLLRLAFDSGARRVTLAADGQCFASSPCDSRHRARPVDRHDLPFCVLTGRSAPRCDLCEACFFAFDSFPRRDALRTAPIILGSVRRVSLGTTTGDSRLCATVAPRAFIYPSSEVRRALFAQPRRRHDAAAPAPIMGRRSLCEAAWKKLCACLYRPTDAIMGICCGWSPTLYPPTEWHLALRRQQFLCVCSGGADAPGGPPGPAIWWPGPGWPPWGGVQRWSPWALLRPGGALIHARVLPWAQRLAGPTGINEGMAPHARDGGGRPPAAGRPVQPKAGTRAY